MLCRGQKWYIIIHFMVIKPRHALFCQGPAGCCAFCAISDSPPRNAVGAGHRPARQCSEWFCSTRRVSPCGASSFFSGEKGTKTPPGVSRGRLTAPAGPPPNPRLRGIPLRPSAKFPAHKIRFQVLIPSGPLGPGRRKILACTISPPRLVPTSRGRGCGIGGAPDGAVSTNRGRASLGLAPTAI